MDAPLLALTRKRTVASEVTATENVRQLIQLRWIAVVGQLVTILVVDVGLGMSLPIGPMLAVVASLALVNIAGMVVIRHRKVGNTDILLALLFDIFSLTVQLYLSGGPANPFVSLYLVQIVLGAILLTSPSVWLLVLVTSLCFALLAVRHKTLVYPESLATHAASLYTLGSQISFILVATLLVLFSARISRNLRARDMNLADLRQRASEEDHIVRMGLFASGAAHALGTPLASLAVILSDWKRMPQLTEDPELLSELEEMQEEVQRCKAIVTDILHSAGLPRAEDAKSQTVDAFLESVVAVWRQAHPLTSLDMHLTGTDQAEIVADPALRQAIFNLLDNAAEASPLSVALHASTDGKLLELSVRDRGRGFDTATLASIGQPKKSSKGPGHGIGLFLVSNVMRRLEGRLEARNLVEGGADVRLFLPLAPIRKG